MRECVVQWSHAVSKLAVGLSLFIVAAGTIGAQPANRTPAAVSAAVHGETTPYHKFLGPWRVIGPIQPGITDQAERMKQSYLGLEELPTLPDQVTSGGETIEAKTVEPGLVNLGLAFDREDEFRHAVAYAETVILSPEEREVVLTLGGDDGVMAWFNAEMVLEHVRPNGVYIDDKTATVTLKAGLNRLLVKSDNITEDWGFAARILPVDQQYSTRLLYHLQPLPVALGNLPEAEMEFLNSTGEVLDKQSVSAWKYRGSPTRAGYIVYPQVQQEPSRVRVTIPVPGTDRKSQHEFAWADAKDQTIGEPGQLSLRGRVVDSQTSEPLRNATLSLTNMATSQVITAEDGTFTMKDIDPAHGRLYVNAAGHLEAVAQVDLRQDEPVTIALVPGGVELTGIIKDEDGNPISGATISFHAAGRQRSAQSDVRGRYSVSGIKSTSKDGMTVYPVVSHPEYQPLGSFSEKIAAEGKTEKDFTLQKGLVVTGTVTSPDGQPVADATVISGEDDFASNSANPKTETAADGTYRLGGLKPGQRHIFAFHDGYAPAMETLNLAGTTETQLNFKLELGKPVTGQIVDSQGKGIAGAMVATDTWRGTRMFRRRATSDENGNFTIPHMPLDEVDSDFLKNGYSSNRDIKLKGGDEGVSVTLASPARVAGIVVDAESGEPITSFTLTKGYDWKNSSSANHWSDAEKLSPSDGKFSFTDTELSNYDRILRIEADGYKTWEYPGSIKAGDQVQDIEARLEKATLLPARVLGPDGSPVAGATVHLFGSGRTLWLGASKAQSKAKTFTADDSGTVNLPDEIAEGDGIFAEKEGVGAILLESFDPATKPLTITLEPYGVVTGAAFEGDSPLPDQEIVLIRGSSQKLQVHYDATTDKNGRFHFDRIPTGEYTLAISRKYENRTTYDRQQKIQVAGGDSQPYLLGGTGGAVVHGTISKEDGTPLPNLSVNLRAPGNQYLSSETDAAGKYEFTDVPAGEMTLSAQTMSFSRTNEERYYGSERVTVPEAAEFEKNMTIIVRKPLAPGSVVKDLAGLDESGTTVTLADQSGEEVPVILAQKQEPEYAELLTSVSKQWKAPQSDAPVALVVLLGKPEKEKLTDMAGKFPQLKFINPATEWTTDYYKRYSLPEKAIGAVLRPNGEVVRIIEDTADNKQLSGEAQ